MSESAQSILGRGRSLLDQVLRIAQTRLELLAAEVQHEKLILMRQCRLALTSAICATLAGVSFIILLALVLPESSRVPVLITACIAFVGGAVGCVLVMRMQPPRPPLFSRVIQQLRLDRASLQDTGD